jgi:hypothetical protein
LFQCKILAGGAEVPSVLCNSSSYIRRDIHQIAGNNDYPYMGARPGLNRAMTEKIPNFAEYHRQGMACLTLARLSDLPDIQIRWTMMAQTWFKLAEGLNNHSEQRDRPNVIPLRRGM